MRMPIAHTHLFEIFAPVEVATGVYSVNVSLVVPSFIMRS